MAFFRKINDVVLNEKKMNAIVSYVTKNQTQNLKILLKYTKNPSDMILQPRQFSDPAERMFNCSIIEYAWWVNDFQIFDMLLDALDEASRAILSKKIAHIEINGLTHKLNGTSYSSEHYNINTLQEALISYLNSYQDFHSNSRYDLIQQSWIKVGIHQRLLPAHYVRRIYPSTTSEIDHNDGVDNDILLNNKHLMLTESWYQSKSLGNTIAVHSISADCKSNAGTSCGFISQSPTYPRNIKDDLKRLINYHTNNLDKKKAYSIILEPQYTPF